MHLAALAAAALTVSAKRIGPQGGATSTAAEALAALTKGFEPVDIAAGLRERYATDWPGLELHAENAATTLLANFCAERHTAADAERYAALMHVVGISGHSLVSPVVPAEGASGRPLPVRAIDALKTCAAKDPALVLASVVSRIIDDGVRDFANAEGFTLTVAKGAGEDTLASWLKSPCGRVTPGMALSAAVGNRAYAPTLLKTLKAREASLVLSVPLHESKATVVAAVFAKAGLAAEKPPVLDLPAAPRSTKKPVYDILSRLAKDDAPADTAYEGVVALLSLGHDGEVEAWELAVHAAISHKKPRLAKGAALILRAVLENSKSCPVRAIDASFLEHVVQPLAHAAHRGMLGGLRDAIAAHVHSPAGRLFDTAVRAAAEVAHVPSTRAVNAVVECAMVSKPADACPPSRLAQPSVVPLACLVAHEQHLVLASQLAAVNNGALAQYAKGLRLLGTHIHWGVVPSIATRSELTLLLASERTRLATDIEPWIIVARAEALVASKAPSSESSASSESSSETRDHKRSKGAHKKASRKDAKRTRKAPTLSEYARRVEAIAQYVKTLVDPKDRDAVDGAKPNAEDMARVRAALRLKGKVDHEKAVFLAIAEDRIVACEDVPLPENGDANAFGRVHFKPAPHLGIIYAFAAPSSTPGTPAQTTTPAAPLGFWGPLSTTRRAALVASAIVILAGSVLGCVCAYRAWRPAKKHARSH